jgi:hypothetical protein
VVLRADGSVTDPDVGEMSWQTSVATLSEEELVKVVDRLTPDGRTSLS